MIEGMNTTRAKNDVKNEDFGQKVGCDFTMASRLRNGHRLPSRDLLGRIVNAYGLDAGEALKASVNAKEFSAYLRAKVFEVKAEKTDKPEEPEE